MLSFRDGVQQLTREHALRDLSARIHAGRCNPGALLGAVLRAGELEAQLEDLRHRSAPAARRLTDDLARAWLGDATAPLEQWLRSLPELPLPAELRLVRPEGYAYYALDPSAYERSVGQRLEASNGVAVVGVRSIGTSLSAVLRAGLQRRGVCCQRITVRPQGHPWDRQLEPSEELVQFVHGLSAAHFLVVDEGPGLSGSTFLAVAEALARLGVPLERIELLTSHRPDPERLVARDAAARWRRFRSTSIAQPVLPAGHRELAAGAWRALAYDTEGEWPACDPALERRKHLAPGGLLFKFVGLPPYDERPLQHAELLAQAGFCPAAARGDGGFMIQPWLTGPRLRLSQQRAQALQRLIDYLSFRSAACPANVPSLAPLQEMLRVNVQEALGWELPSSVRLELQRPVYADGRLAAEEWIQLPGGALLKADAIDHGDDHQFPGPCDSAWDVAGAVIEWSLTPSELSELCTRYRQRSGDGVSSRLGPHLLAYSALRVAQCSNASLSAPPGEQPRLARRRQFYLRALRRWAACHGWCGRAGAPAPRLP